MFDGASAEFLRDMLVVGGRILDDIAASVPASGTLLYICGSARDLLGAGRVEVNVLGADSEIIATYASGDHPADGPTLHTAVVRGTADLASLQIWWEPDSEHPTEVERVVGERFGRMILIVLDEATARRSQLLAVTRERETFAGEIHDEPIQIMTAVSLELQRLATALPDTPGIDHARHLTDQAIDELRHIMYSLHPPTLEEDGLRSTIEAYCENYIEALGLRWEVDDQLGDRVLPLEVAALAFRLTRGALLNVLKHAAADVVTISLCGDQRRLQVVVADNGVGFDTAELAHTRIGHFGIPHAKTLANWVGGSYQTDSEPGRGTTVTIELPTG